MKKLNKNLKLAISCILAFIILIIAFQVTGALIRNGAIANIVIPKALEGLFAFVFFVPLFLSLFFFSKFFENKGARVPARIFKFVSIALLCYGLLMTVLTCLFNVF